AGTISSLQRHLEIQEAQLRRINSEKETLQRKLRERENELQAMSAKFCSLREDRAQGEMIVTMEKENCSLRQVVTELESKLAEQKELIAELQGTVSQLRAEVRSGQQHICTQQQAQEVLRSQAEALQHRMLQTSVALESITSKFERYRNKIIQNTFSAAGSKAPQAEVSDEEVLEAMQVCGSSKLRFPQRARD
ncbi:CCD27 protein, partial [Centropus bengalensis]|nr:CCD27 protein [Centropus bengalensis]